MSADQGAQGKRSTTPPGSPARPSLRVLFIDADPQRPEALRRALPQSCAVATVSSIQAAVGVLSQQAPDLIVTDLDLPDGSGVQLIMRVHHDPATRHVLLMVVTSRAMLSDKIAALEAGADDYLVRPVDPERFALHVQLISRFRRTLPW
jgi:two-component system cell cycle response regulator